MIVISTNHFKTMFALSRYMFLIRKYEKAEQQQTQVGQLKADQQKSCATKRCTTEKWSTANCSTNMLNY